jgi:CCR4-NOT transcriptional complex subunit CAF120
MVDEGESTAMLQWIVGISDVFKVSSAYGLMSFALLMCTSGQLYGRPRAFSFDPRDPSSLYFALPVGPHRDRQFLDRECTSASLSNALFLPLNQSNLHSG